MQVLEGRSWLSFDPERGHARELPQTYLPVRLGGDFAVEVVNGQKVRTEFYLELGTLDPRVFASGGAGWRDVFDLSRLPLATRSTLALLMLLPVAVVCTLAARRLLGVRSFGTFTPALLGLAATALDWRSTLVVFALVAVLAGAGRAVAPRLRLARDLRLGVVFLLVALGMAYGVSLLGFTGQETGNMVVLLPMVVLTMLVDRFYTVADESGPGTALRRLVWTVALSVVAFAILLNDDWGHWLVLNPQAHAVTLGVVLLLGSYAGKRLSDTVVGRWLGETQTADDNPGS